MSRIFLVFFVQANPGGVPVVHDRQNLGLLGAASNGTEIAANVTGTFLQWHGDVTPMQGVAIDTAILYPILRTFKFALMR